MGYTTKYYVKLREGHVLIFDENLNKIDEINSDLECANDLHPSSDILIQGSRLITCGDFGIEYWDTSLCKFTHKNTIMLYIYTMTLLPNNLIAIAGEQNIIYILEENVKIYKKISVNIYLTRRIYIYI